MALLELVFFITTMRSNQSIKVIRSPKYGISKNEGADMHDTAVHYENKLIHEHDFITIGIKKTNSSLVRCITCGEYYCDICGKALQ
jgi:hypothetical protein